MGNSVQRTGFGFIASLCALMAALGPSPVQAHRINTALSVIEVNPRTGRLEISHTLYAHDLEHALLAGAVNLAWLESPEGEQALKAYCLRQFSLQTERRRPVAITFVGSEVIGDKINIYFEGPRYSGRALIVDSNLLQDISERQVNQVNLRAKGQTVTARFAAGEDPKRLVLPR